MQFSGLAKTKVSPESELTKGKEARITSTPRKCLNTVLANVFLFYNYEFRRNNID